VKVFVTGGSGFIGSNLVDALLEAGHGVTAYDNLSTGRRRFLDAAESHRGFRFVHADLLDAAALNSSIVDHDAVVHLAANADVRFGWNHPNRDHEQNVVATLNVLEAMRRNSIRRVLFSSTGSVYGECAVTADRRPIKLLNLIDEHTCECPEILVERSITADMVVAMLDRTGLVRLDGSRGSVHRSGLPLAERLDRVVQRPGTRRTVERRAVHQPARSPRRDRRLAHRLQHEPAPLIARDADPQPTTLANAGPSASASTTTADNRQLNQPRLSHHLDPRSGSDHHHPGRK